MHKILQHYSLLITLFLFSSVPSYTNTASTTSSIEQPSRNKQNKKGKKQHKLTTKQSKKKRGKNPNKEEKASYITVLITSIICVVLFLFIGYLIKKQQLQKKVNAILKTEEERKYFEEVLKKETKEKPESLIQVAINGHLNVLKAYLTAFPKDVNIQNKNGVTLLHFAVGSKLPEVIKLLISSQADVNKQDDIGRTPLHIAFDKGHFEIAKLLIKNGADIGIKDNDKNNRTPLQLLLYNANDDQAKEFINLIQDVTNNINVTDTLKCTFMHYAAAFNCPNIIDFLIAKGAKVDTKNIIGVRPLYDAMCAGSLEIVKKLIEAGASVNEPTHHGWTPLHIAIKCIHLEIVNLLLSNNADVNAKLVLNGTSYTPLELAKDSLDELNIQLKNEKNTLNEQQKEEINNKIKDYNEIIKLITPT